MPITDDTLTQVRDLRVTVGTEADNATRATTNAWVSGWDQVAPAYLAALTGITATAAASGAWPGPWDLVRDPGLQQASTQARTVLSQLANGAGGDAVTAATNATAATVDAEPHIMASQLPAAEQATASQRFGAALGVTGVAALLGAVAPRIGPLTGPLSAASAAAINRAITSGAHPTSGSPQALTARVLTAVEQGFNAGLASAIAMVRTETLDAYRVASRQVHTANALVVAGWYWRSMLAPNTCGSCWALHGTFHPVTEFGPFDHRQGRCIRVAKLRPWVQLGIARREPPDRLGDARKTFNGLPEADQLNVLGPARLDLLRSGRITWDDIPVLRTSSAWRPAYVPRTVAALRSIARARASDAA